MVAFCYSHRSCRVSQSIEAACIPSHYDGQQSSCLYVAAEHRGSGEMQAGKTGEIDQGPMEPLGLGQFSIILLLGALINVGEGMGRN